MFHFGNFENSIYEPMVVLDGSSYLPEMTGYHSVIFKKTKRSRHAGERDLSKEARLARKSTSQLSCQSLAFLTVQWPAPGDSNCQRLGKAEDFQASEVVSS